MIDRIAPTLRPTSRPVGFQEWRSLLFMHWPVPIEVLRPLVPHRLELDLHEGVAYIGLVPFVMRSVRPRWCPKLLGFNFLETNVRTYVSCAGRPGVYFFSLDAASRIAVWIARKLWGLPYYHASMGTDRDSEFLQYRSQRTATEVCHKVRARIGDECAASRIGSIEFFLLERYLLFLEKRDKLHVGQVHHSPYPVCEAEVLELEDDLLAAAGFACCQGLPPLVHFSDGVDVEIFRLEEFDMAESSEYLTRS